MAMRYPQGVDVAAATAAGFILDRCEAVPALIGNPADFLIVTGLAGTARDIAALTHDSAQIYTMAGAMGGAVMIGLGLALARPDKRVLVATGDGEILMNVGALATVAIMNPANFSILVVDNGHYGETGWQKSHTSLGVDLEKIADRRRHPAHPHGRGRKRAGRWRAPAARGQRRRLCRAPRRPGRTAVLQAQFRPGRLPQPLPFGAARRELDMRRRDLLALALCLAAIGAPRFATASELTAPIEQLDAALLQAMKLGNVRPV